MTLRSLQVYGVHISKLIGTDLHLFELSVWLESFAMSLLSVFIPIILYQFGLSLKEVIIFYIIFNFIDVPFNLVAKQVIKAYGARAAVILATCSKIISLVIFYFLTPEWDKIFFFALTLAIYDSFYWVGHLYIFASSVHKSKVIKEDVSLLQIIRFLGAVLAPIAGAYVLIYTDQRTLIFLSTIMMLVSLLPLFRMRNLKFKPERPSLKFREFFKSRYEQVNYLFEMFAALREEAENVLWPFFIFFVYGSLRTVAYIPTLIAISSLILIYYTGSRSMPKRIFKFVAAGALLLTIIWMLRIGYYGNEIFAIGSVFVVSLLTILIDIPLEVSIFERARGTDELSAVTYLNFFRMLARGLLYVFLLFMILISPDMFISGFYLVAASMFILFVLSAIVARRLESRPDAVSAAHLS